MVVDRARVPNLHGLPEFTERESSGLPLDPPLVGQRLDDGEAGLVTQGLEGVGEFAGERLVICCGRVVPVGSAGTGGVVARLSVTVPAVAAQSTPVGRRRPVRVRGVGHVGWRESACC